MLPLEYNEFTQKPSSQAKSVWSANMPRASHDGACGSSASAGPPSASDMPDSFGAAGTDRAWAWAYGHMGMGMVNKDLISGGRAAAAHHQGRCAVDSVRA